MRNLWWNNWNKGLIDFGIVFGQVDHTRYNSLKMPTKDIWGVLMRRDSALAQKETIAPEDLWDKPLIISHQRNQGKELSAWMKRDISKLNVVATYNLLFNASLLVDEGLGYAIRFCKIINITENSSLCFRPLQPNIEIEMSLVWKKYQIFTKAAEQFIKKNRKKCRRPAPQTVVLPPYRHQFNTCFPSTSTNCIPSASTQGSR